MDQSNDDLILSSALLAEIEAVAASENRSSRDVLQEAVERFLRERRENVVKRRRGARQPRSGCWPAVRSIGFRRAKPSAA